MNTVLRSICNQIDTLAPIQSEIDTEASAQP